MDNNKEVELLEKILREVQDIKVILQEASTEHDIHCLKEKLLENK